MALLFLQRDRGGLGFRRKGILDDVGANRFLSKYILRYIIRCISRQDWIAKFFQGTLEMTASNCM
jgi:hypothetical protein